MEVTLSDLPLITLLARIRRAILMSLGFIIVLGALCWFFTDSILAYLFAMYTDVDGFVFTHVSESFFVKLKLAAACGFTLSIPLILWQLRSVVAPFISLQNRSLSYAFIPFASLLFYSGLTFAVWAILPLAVRFFLGFDNAGVEPLLRLESIVNFSISLALPMAIVFQLPLVIYFLARLGVLSATMLRNARKYSILGIVIISAILTPADVFSQIMMAIPLVVLYEISIWLAHVAQRGRQSEQR